MSFSNKPRIQVFAGPNGSGKSSITAGATIQGFYVNADELKKQLGITDLEAALRAEKIRRGLIDKRLDFTFETVLSTDRNIELLRHAKEVGYTIEAVFVLTRDAKINVERVKQRVLAGGHDVPVDKIISRYNRSIANISKLAEVADYMSIIDNSDGLPSELCRIRGHEVSVWPNENWTEESILALIGK